MSLTPKPKKTKSTPKKDIKKSLPHLPTPETQKHIKKHLADVKPSITKSFIKLGYAKSPAEADALYDMYSAAVKMRYYGYEYDAIEWEFQQIVGQRGWMDLMGY
jgi:hypothetical protein